MAGVFRTFGVNARLVLIITTQHGGNGTTTLCLSIIQETVIRKECTIIRNGFVYVGIIKYS